MKKNKLRKIIGFGKLDDIFFILLILMTFATFLHTESYKIFAEILVFILTKIKTLF